MLFTRQERAANLTFFFLSPFSFPFLFLFFYNEITFRPETNVTISTNLFLLPIIPRLDRDLSREGKQLEKEYRRKEEDEEIEA